MSNTESMSGGTTGGNTGQVIPVDIGKLGYGMKQIFLGCAAVFDSLGVPADMVTGQMPGMSQVEELKRELKGSVAEAAEGVVKPGNVK